MILAAVSINAAFNTGIIDTAVNGAVNYAEAQRQEQVTFDELDESLQDILNRINEYDVGGSNPNVPEPTPVPDDEKQDGSWNGTKEMNSPKVAGTGLIPVYHNGTSWVDLTEISSKEEWANWYDYDTQKWANARTADGSMWVWIPRYEYKIDSTAKTIDVRFIKTDVKAGTEGYTTDSTGIVKSSDDYIVHPAFMDDSTNGYNNGGWDSDIEGFWVAKYPAGWQNGTDGIDTSIGTPEYSNLMYETSASSNTYVGTITNNSTKMSYPVFKANTYAYNYISAGDSYKISAEIATATDIYGLNSSKIDSHLEKNSEWGAMAYLAHSKYGVNGQDLVAQNSTYKGNSPKGVYAVTSPETVINTSTTQNITGVYDLSGCVYERVAGFCQGGTTAHTTGMPTGTASKYVALYTTNDKKGDATNETSGWNSDYANFVSSDHPVFHRGYVYIETSGAGIFAFQYGYGNPSDKVGFRAVLIAN